MSHNNDDLQKLRSTFERIRSWEGGHVVPPPPRERERQRPIIASVILTIVVAGTSLVHLPPLLLLFHTQAHGRGQRLAPATASPLPITAFLLVRALPLVLQGERSQQPHVIAPDHQPLEGGLGIAPLFLTPPPIFPPSCSFFPVRLLAVVVVVAVVVEVVVVVVVAVPPTVGRPPRPGRQWGGGSEVLHRRQNFNSY